MKNINKIRIIGVPYLYGKNNPLRSEAPNVLRKSGLHKAFQRAGLSYEDIGDIEISKISTKDSSLETKLKYFSENKEIIKLLATEVEGAISSKKIPILLGGDHSITIGALLGVAACSNDVSLIYMDTHGDFHTSQTTPSGWLHGMSLALSLGLDKSFSKLYGSDITYFDKSKVTLFGAQKFDLGEKEAVVSNISLIDMNFITQHGIGNAIDKLLSQIKTKKIYVSLDLDVVDKGCSPGTDMSIYGALTYRELFYMIERISEEHDVIGMDVVEFSPDKDIEGKTASLAIESITAVLGKRVGTYELYMDKIDKI